MKCLLFEPCLSGHRMEYIHHFYSGMIENDKNEYVILVPEKFKDLKVEYNWDKSNNVLLEYIPQPMVDKMDRLNSVIAAYFKLSLMRSYIKRHSTEKVFIISSIMEFMPFLLLMLPKRVKFQGIIYKFHWYNWSNISIVRKVLFYFIYYRIANDCRFERLYCLNDKSSVCFLNRKFDTTKFNYLPDPFLKMNYTPKNIRKEFGIPHQDLVYLHFGGLSIRKGTMLLLNTIAELPQSVVNHMTFIFAGKIYEEIKEDFYNLYSFLKENNVKILVFDRFCKTSFIADLCYSCDAILIPYQETAQSSGVIGWAAYYKKPVIGPKSGLIGKLLRKHKLGRSVIINQQSLKNEIVNFSKTEIVTDYMEIADLSLFKKIIFEHY